MKGEYKLSENGDLEVTNGMVDDFNKLGYVHIRGLLNSAELSKLQTALEHDEGIMTKSYFIGDGVKNKTKMCVWNHPGNDITGLISRTEKVASTCERLMGGEVYHYHTKLMMKDPKGGGQFLWHQDYGYWYYNGCIKPDMLTVFISVDPCTKENGCLQVIPGSHRCGRLDHKAQGGQMEANPERRQEVENAMGKEYVEMKEGDALFFHSNLLHCSADNLSDKRRWAFLCCYNMKENNPNKKHHHARYVPLEKVPNSSVMECGTDTDLRGKGFILQAKTDQYKSDGFHVEDDHLN